MSDDTSVNPEADPLKPSPETFDLGSFLTGRTYPEDVIHVYLDEQAISQIQGLVDLRNDLELEDEPDTAEIAKIQGLIDQAQAAAEASLLKITIRGVANRRRLNVFTKINEEFPMNPKAFRTGTADAKDRERNEATVLALWNLHIVKIENAQGQVIESIPTQFINELYEESPEPVIARITTAINDLQHDQASKFESYVKEPDFLSRPSHEG